jgi:hypothetical protein
LSRQRELVAMQRFSALVSRHKKGKIVIFVISKLRLAILNFNETFDQNHIFLPITATQLFHEIQTKF